MKRLIWILLLLLAAGLAYWGLSRALTPTSAYAHAKRGQAIYAVTGSVTVSTEADSQIVSPEDGILKVSSLVEGQTVHQGDILAKLDSGDIPFLQNEVSANLTDIDNRLKGKLPSEMGLDILKQDLDDNKKLLDQKFYPQANYTKDQRTYEQQEAAAQQERATLATQRTILQNTLDNYTDQIRRLTIFAPYDGAITSVSAHPGDLMTKGAPVAAIISSSLKIQAEVNQDDIAAVLKNEHEKATIRFFAYPDLKFDAQVKQVLPSSNKATQRFTVLLEVANPPAALFAGLTGEVSFIAGENDNTLLVPRRALFGNSVFVVKDGRVQVRTVQVGFLSLTHAEIKSGVSEGETVLTAESLDQFRDGDRVILTDDTDAPSK